MRRRKTFSAWKLVSICFRVRRTCRMQGGRVNSAIEDGFERVEVESDRALKKPTQML
jgi:hypothetical protein